VQTRRVIPLGVRLASLLLAVSLLAASGPGRPVEPTDAASLAEAHFKRMFGFDGLEAYESRRGPARTTFAVARRWDEGRAKILIDIHTPDSFSKWALLILHNHAGSDDMFVYVPILKRVRRFAAIQMERQVLFDVLPLGELRPIVPGELEYTRIADTEVEREPCLVVEGRPRHRGLGFDHVELALSPTHGVALRTRYFVGKREIRRVLISPDDIRDWGGRLLPVRRRIVTPPGSEVTELILHNLLADLELPANLFSTHNLRVQRFPSF
jgi:hypothetical protein